MPERRSSFIINDILRCIEHTRQYTTLLTFENFISNYMVIEACLYNIQVIGEAVSHLPEEIKQTEPQVPWNLIKGMRNRLIHEYFGTDLQLVWNVITNELPALQTELNRIYSTLKEKGQ